MAKLLSQAGGDAAVAVLSNEDRAFLEKAVKAYTTINCSTVGDFAKELGVGRTYVYNLLTGNTIELSRLHQLHDLLGVNILEDSQVDAYIQLESAKLTGRSIGFHWTSQCPSVKVDKFYLKNFLLSSIESETNFFDQLYNSTIKNGKFVVAGFEEEAYMFGKIIDFVKYTLHGMGSESSSEIDSDFYERSDNILTPSIEIPITTSNGLWKDIEEATHDHIYAYYCFDENQGLFKKYGEQHLDVDFIEGLLRDKISTLEVGQSEPDSEYEILVNQLEFAVILSKHKDFFRRLDWMIDRINEDLLKIQKYCSKNSRTPRRRSYFPYELQKLADDLESGTF